MFVDSVEAAMEFVRSWESAVERGEVSADRAARALEYCALTNVGLKRDARDLVMLSAQCLHA